MRCFRASQGAGRSKNMAVAFRGGCEGGWKPEAQTSRWWRCTRGERPCMESSVRRWEWRCAWNSKLWTRPRDGCCGARGDGVALGDDG